MPPNRRANRPVPVRRPKIAGGSRSIRPRAAESTTATATEPRSAVSPAESQHTHEQAASVQTTERDSTQVQPTHPEQPELRSQPPRTDADEAPLFEADEGPAEAEESAPAATRRFRLRRPALGRRRRPSLRTSLIAAAVAAAVLVGAATVVEKVYFDHKVTNQAYVDNAGTDEVKAAAANALTAISSYKFDQIDKWPDAARAVLTDQMKQDFDKTVDVTKSAAVQAKTSTDVHVDPVGVTMLDDEHAEVLAFMTVSVTNDGQAQGSSTGPQLVRMQKVDGHWLLSEVELQ